MYVVGQSIRLASTVHDSTGALYDPASVVFNVTTPAGVTTSTAAVRDSTGVYHFNYTPAVPGSFTWWFSGTGSVQLPDVFTVAPASTAALVSLADVKAHLNKTTQAFNIANTDDDELWRFIQAATEIINSECGYTAVTPSTETVNFGSLYRSPDIILSRTPVLSVQSITPTLLGAPTYDLSTLVIDNEAGVIYFSNWWQFYGPATIAYTAGRGFVPAALQTACLLIVADLWETQRGGATNVPGVDGDESGPPTLGVPYQALQLMKLSPYRAAPGIA